MKNLLLACLFMLFVASPGFGQTPTLGVVEQFEYGDINYSWNDPIAFNLPTELYALEDGGTDLITRPGGYRRIAFSMEHVGTTAAVRMKVGDHRARTFDATADIDTTPLTETITITGGVNTPHEYQQPDGPYKLATTGACPAGLSTSALYFVEVVDVNTIAFHTSYVDALAALPATRVDLGVAAVGTCTIGGLPTVPTADSTNGYESLGLYGVSQSTAGGSVNWPPIVLWMPERLTVTTTATKVLVYWFLP